MPKRNQDWIITRDHLDGNINLSKNSFPDPERFKIYFRLYDDDGTLYFEGYMTRDLYDQGEDIFSPLDDFGTPGYGCTFMMVKNPQTNKLEVV